MKRIFWLMIMATLVLTACDFEINLESPKKEPEQEEAKEKPAKPKEDEVDEEEPIAEVPETDKVDDGNGEIVEVNITKDFFFGMTSEEIIADYHEQGIEDVTENGDSYTLRMPKEQHEALLKELKTQADTEIKELVGLMNIEFITDITTNDTVTELIVSLDQELYGGDMQGLVLSDFALYGINYQAMSGVHVDDMDFEVVLIDDETGEEIERTSMRDE